MSCCTGDTQTRSFDVTLNWRSVPDSERRLKFTMNGADGQWTGQGSGEYDMGPAVYSCGVRDPKGNVVIRVNAAIKCVEDGINSFISGHLQITFGKTTFGIRVRPHALICTDGGPNSTVEWPQLWLGPLGEGKLLLVGSKAKPI